MGYEIPTISKCCFYFPRRSGLLIYGYIKVIFCIIMEILNISLLLKVALPQIAPIIIGAQVASLFLDCGSVIVFIIGCHKNNLLLISWYYTYSLFILAIKMFFMIILCFLDPLFILLTIAGFLFNVYLLLLIRSEYIHQKKINQTPAEFVNKLANPQCVINIEVIDNAIPETGIPYNGFVINGIENNDVKEATENSVVKNDVKKPNETPF